MTLPDKDLDEFEARLAFSVSLGRTIHGPISRYRHRKKLPRFYNRDILPGIPSRFIPNSQTWGISSYLLEKNRYYDDSTVIYADLTYLFYNDPVENLFFPLPPGINGRRVPMDIDYPTFTPKSYFFEGLQDVSIIFSHKNNHITLHNCVNVNLTCHPISGLDVIGCTDVYLTIKEITYLNIEDCHRIDIRGEYSPSSLLHIARSTHISRKGQESKIGYDFDFDIFSPGIMKRTQLHPVYLLPF